MKRLTVLAAAVLACAAAVAAHMPPPVDHGWKKGASTVSMRPVDHGW